MPAMRTQGIIVAAIGNGECGLADALVLLANNTYRLVHI
jgi:hypothetical protein